MAEMRTAGHTELRFGRTLSIVVLLLVVLSALAVWWLSTVQRPSELAAPSEVAMAGVSEETLIDVGGIMEVPNYEVAAPLNSFERKIVESDFSYDADNDLNNRGIA